MKEDKTMGSSIAKIIGLICLGIILTAAMGACSSSTPTDTLTSAPTATPSVTPTPTPRPPPIPLFLDIISPEDESVVATSEVEVIGETLPTAIVSVNGTLVPVEADGGFSTTVTLEEAPNVIEIVASDIGGTQEEGTVLMVTYLP